MARQVLELAGKVEHGGRDVVIGPALVVGLSTGRFDPAPHVDLFRPRILLTDGVAERLRRLSHGRARSVGDDVGNLRGVLAAVLVVHVLDRLFAAIGLDVDVDVGRAVALG